MSVRNIDLRRRAIELFQQHGLLPFREILTHDLFRSISRREERASTILTEQVVFWLMGLVALSDGVLSAAVLKFWTPLLPLLPTLAFQPVTEEAFCIARGRLPIAFFRDLFNAVLARYQEDFGHRYHWKGLRLWGIDGTLLELSSLSPVLRRMFPSFDREDRPSKVPKARLVGLVGLRDGVSRGFLLGTIRLSEHTCVRRLLQLLTPGDLLLADKNFVSTETFALLASRKVPFLFRLSSGQFTRPARRRTPSRRKNEGYITLKVPHKLLLKHPGLPSILTLRVLDYHFPGGEAGRLITSLLETRKYPYHEVVSLYHERWMQETVYREWKQNLNLSNLRSHSRTGLYKEVFVQLTLNNAIRWLMAKAAGEDQRPVELQFLNAKRLILHTLPLLPTAPVLKAAQIYHGLLEEIAKQVILKRPGRRYPRGPRDKTPVRPRPDLEWQKLFGHPLAGAS